MLPINVYLNTSTKDICDAAIIIHDQRKKYGRKIGTLSFIQTSLKKYWAS